MGDTVHVKGLSDLQSLLDTLPAKLEKNIMRGALRAGMKPVQIAAKQNLESSNSNITGLLSKGLKIYTRAKNGTVTASVRAAGKHGYVARWVEYGTAAHRISGKNGAMLAFGGGFARFVDHPGARAKAFMRPALDSQATAAVIASGEYIKKRLATKEGLDTSDIMIEGDES